MVMIVMMSKPKVTNKDEFFRGIEVCLTELDDEVRIVVQNDGRELDRESWKKTDKAQFMWAIRGKCQKVLTQ